MDEHVLDLIEQMIQGRNTFLGRSSRILPANTRSATMSRYMVNELMYLETINRIYHNHIRNQLATTVLTITLPSNFLDPVPVVATMNQINNALEDVEPSTTNCAVCQEVISSAGVKIRGCGHLFHRSCIVSWLGMSVRCPVCRHDIRREDLEEETPPASEQTSSQEEDQ